MAREVLERCFEPHGALLRYWCRVFVFVYVLYVRMCVCALVYVCKVIISPYQRILLRHFLRCSVRACVRLFASVSLCAWCVHLGREFLENAFFLWCLRAFVTLLNKMHFELLFFYYCNRWLLRKSICRRWWTRPLCANSATKSISCGMCAHTIPICSHRNIHTQRTHTHTYTHIHTHLHKQLSWWTRPLCANSATRIPPSHHEN